MQVVRFETHIFGETCLVRVDQVQAISAYGPNTTYIHLVGTGSIGVKGSILEVRDALGFTEVDRACP